MHPYCEELDGPMYPTNSTGSSPTRHAMVHWASAGRDPTEDVPTSPQRRTTRVSVEEDSPENDDHNNDGEPTTSTTMTNENNVIVDDLDLFLADQRSISPQCTSPPTGMDALLDRPISGVIRTASAVSSISNATRSSSIASSGEASTESAKKRRRNRHARSSFVLDGNSFSVTPNAADPIVSVNEKQHRLHHHHHQRDPLGVGGLASSLSPTALFPSTLTASAPAAVTKEKHQLTSIYAKNNGPNPTRQR